jgi:hypothetical protein
MHPSPMSDADTSVTSIFNENVYLTVTKKVKRNANMMSLVSIYRGQGSKQINMF